VREIVPGRDKHSSEIPDLRLDLIPGKYNNWKHFRVREVVPGRDKHPFEIPDLRLDWIPGKYSWWKYFQVREVVSGRDTPSSELPVVVTPGKFGSHFGSSVAGPIPGKFDWKFPGMFESSLLLLGGSGRHSRRLASGWHWASERQSAIR